MNAYEILECKPNSTQQELKESYHKLLLKYHPDKQIDQTNNSNDQFIKINSAFKLLSNPIERKQYDSLLKQAELNMTRNSLDEDNLFILEKDFCLNDENELYTNGCDRCGGVFKLGLNEKNELIRNHSIADSLVVCLECENCSLTKNVLIL